MKLEATSKTTIILVDYNGLDDTLKCLESLSKLSGPKPQVIVVDNGSSPSVATQIESAFGNVEVLRSEENLGWAGGNNLGIRHALQEEADYLLLLNNDTVVAPELIDSFLAAADAHPDYGIFGCIVCYMDEPDEVNMDGCRFDVGEETSFFTRQPVPDSTDATVDVTETEIVFGCCMFIRREVFEKIGLIDEDFFLIHEESDFCLRAIENGYRCGILGKRLVWHKGSSTFAREGKPLQRYFDARNLYRLLQKHPRTVTENPERRRSWKKYLKHVYYFYCLQRDAGNMQGARAVLEGLSDGIFGHYGPLMYRWRPLVPILCVMFECRRTWSILTKGS